MISQAKGQPVKNWRPGLTKAPSSRYPHEAKASGHDMVPQPFKVLRLGYRKGRDPRITTHLALFQEPWAQLNSCSLAMRMKACLRTCIRSMIALEVQWPANMLALEWAG